MFVTGEVDVDAGWEVAQPRFAALITQGWVGHAAESAYESDFSALVRVGPLGPVPGLSKQVRVLFLDPVRREDSIRVALRWEATGTAGRMFPVLDADLTLTRGPDGTGTRLALAGAYRPPLDGPGVLLDRVMLHRAATATISNLLARVANGLTSPAPAAAPASGVIRASRRPIPEGGI